MRYRLKTGGKIIMSKVQRYDSELEDDPYNNSTYAVMDLNEDTGEWVRYVDFKRLEDRLIELGEEVELYAVRK